MTIVATTLPPGKESLADAIAAFKEETGRADLTDAKVTRYLNRGQKWLDEVTESAQEDARHIAALENGQIGIVFGSECRTIKEVWLLDYEGDQRIPLDPKSTPAIRELYPNLIANIDTGQPVYYCRARLRTDVQYTIGGLAGAYGFFDALFAQPYKYNGILVFPPADGDYSIEVQGRWYTPALSDDNSQTWWLWNHFDLLLTAAKRELEVDYRNREGRKDWEEAMAPTLQAITHDKADDDSVGINRLEG